MQTQQHEYFMEQAYELALKAQALGEVPVGAVVVYNNEIIGKGYNRVIKTHAASAHAEVIAIQEAGEFLQNYRLLNCKLYVTLEPCIMCAGAMIHARIQELIFAAYDPRAGAVCNAFELFTDKSINHEVRWRGGILEEPCSDLLKAFFLSKR